jgi:K+ transporter
VTSLFPTQQTAFGGTMTCLNLQVIDLPSNKLRRAINARSLGVVYGDIGTSPLYTFKTAIAWAGGEATPGAVLGMLSLIVWTLVITTSIKYVAIVMRPAIFDRDERTVLQS